MKQPILIAIVVAFIATGAGFLGGMKFQEAKNPPFAGQFANGQRGQFTTRNVGNGQGFQPINGEIIESDENSITVKLEDGSSKIVLLSESTNINKAETGSKDDLKSGNKVLVMGSTNSDGSISAQNIQLNPSSQFLLRNTQ